MAAETPPLARRIFARGFLTSAGGCAVCAAGFAVWLAAAGGVPGFLDVASLLLIALCAGLLGWIVGVLIVWPLAYRLARAFLPLRYETGQLVQILTGARCGRVARIYELWPERDQLRLELDDESWRKVKDVYAYQEVCALTAQLAGWKEDFVANTRARAATGERRAQKLLGHLHHHGDGVPKDYIEALFWTSLAAQGEDRKTALAETIYGANLTPEQIEAVRQRVRDWKPGSDGSQY